MKVITKEYKTFTYDELSDSGKDTAFTNWQESQTEWFWIDETIDSMKMFANHFDITVKDYSVTGSGYGSSYVTFEIDGEEELSEMSYVRLWKYLKNNNYEFVKWNKPESKYTLDPGKTTIYDCCPFTGYCADDDTLIPIREFLEKPYDITFYDLVDKCFDSWLKCCIADMDYQATEECFLEGNAHDQTYLEDGSIF